MGGCTCGTQICRPCLDISARVGGGIHRMKRETGATWHLSRQGKEGGFEICDC